MRTMSDIKGTLGKENKKLDITEDIAESIAMETIQNKMQRKMSEKN